MKITTAGSRKLQALQLKSEIVNRNQFQWGNCFWVIAKFA